jgi:hypothetical protein
MGLFDRLLGKRDPEPKPAAPAAEGDVSLSAEKAPKPAGKIMPRLVEAREKLEAKDLEAAKKIYEEVLNTSGERPDVLVTISGDLGVNGYLREIADLIGPLYDADKHGPATGLNLLQTYLALRQADAAQHILDILYALNRPELEDRLHGFSNALGDLIHSDLAPLEENPTSDDPDAANDAPADIRMVSLSKPIWYYGLEEVEGVLPEKGEKLRHVAFAQLALPGIEKIDELAGQPEEEMGRLCRAIPLWLTESFYFSPHYQPSAAIGVTTMQPGQAGHYGLFHSEWTTDNLQQLVNTTESGLDYIFTGAIHQKDGDYEIILRVWEVRKFRERKQFTARWTPATADEELAKLHEQIRMFMEWSADESALAYHVPASPRAWLETLGASATLFLAEKQLLPPDQMPDFTEVVISAGKHAASNEAASLACLTLQARLKSLDLEADATPPELANTPLIESACVTLG